MIKDTFRGQISLTQNVPLNILTAIIALGYEGFANADEIRKTATDQKVWFGIDNSVSATNGTPLESGQSDTERATKKQINLAGIWVVCVDGNTKLALDIRGL